MLERFQWPLNSSFSSQIKKEYYLANSNNTLGARTRDTERERETHDLLKWHKRAEHTHTHTSDEALIIFGS